MNKILSLQKIIAFTLAEVLITLGIIGVVAALTIPSLQAKIDERVKVTKLKKFYTTMTESIRLNAEENSTTWMLKDHILDAFRVVKICSDPDDYSCDNKRYKGYNGTTSVWWGSNDGSKNLNAYALLQDGSVVRYSQTFHNTYSGKDCNASVGVQEQFKHVCGEVSVDINGAELPNVFGKDVFFFYVTEYGLIPFGTKGTTPTYSDFASNCRTQGHACAAYVLKFESLDYNKYTY